MKKYSKARAVEKRLGFYPKVSNLRNKIRREHSPLCYFFNKNPFALDTSSTMMKKKSNSAP